MNAHIQSLQEQVDDLYANLNALHNRQDIGIPQEQGYDDFSQRRSLGPSTSQLSFQNPSSLSQNRSNIPHFRGPTSSAYNFDVAKTSLQTMGISAPEVEVVEGELAPNAGQAQISVEGHTQKAQTALELSKEPLWMLGREEAIRLCRAYDEEMGMMYPILDIERTIKKARMLFTFIESAARTGLMERMMDASDTFYDDETNILKMVLATALMVQGNGESHLGRRLFDSVRSSCEGRLWQPVNMKGLILLVIVVWLLAA